MIDRTSTENAGWTLVEADNKYTRGSRFWHACRAKLETAIGK